jgi:hypothetical protein
MNSLISPADLDRIDSLETCQKNPDILWLCQLARRLAALKPTEAVFSEYLALINYHSAAAYPIRRAETSAPAEHELNWVGGPGPVVLLQHTLICELSDAFLCVRPYVKLVSPKSEGVLEQLARLGRITVRADKTLLVEGTLAEHLVGFDGYGVHRKPFTFRASGQPQESVFGVGILNGDQSASPAELGVFLPHRTVITIELTYPLQAGEEIKLSTGLVMARYTTKDCTYWPTSLKVTAAP